MPMPSNRPLPAAQLLALADAMANTHTASPDFFEARDAYKAARGASPVTLEEELARTAAAWATEHSIDPKSYATQDGESCTLGIAYRMADAINARRLAGGGGA